MAVKCPLCPYYDFVDKHLITLSCISLDRAFYFVILSSLCKLFHGFLSFLFSSLATMPDSKKALGENKKAEQREKYLVLTPDGAAYDKNNGSNATCPPDPEELPR